MKKSTRERLGEAIGLIDKMVDLETEKVRLLRELQRGLTIAQLLGRTPKELDKPVRLRHLYGGSVFRPWVGYDLAIEVDGEPQVRIPILKVPERLWDQEILAQYKRYQRREEKRRQPR